MRTRFQSVARWGLLVPACAALSALLSQFVSEFATPVARGAIALALVVVVAGLVGLERRILRGHDPGLAQHLARVAAVFAFLQISGWAFVAWSRNARIESLLLETISVPGLLVLRGLERMGMAAQGATSARPSPLDAFAATLLVAGFWTLAALFIAKLTRHVAKRLGAPRTERAPGASSTPAR